MIAGRGFTLLEQMVCIAIIAVLSAIALPNFSELIDKTEADNFSRSLFHLMQYGRYTAISRKSNVVICQIEDLTQGDCILNKNWQHPYYVFIDGDRNRKLTLPTLASTGESDTKDVLLRAYPAKPDSATLITTRESFSFSPPGTTGNAGSMTYCPANPYHAARIIVMSSGRVRYARPEEISCPT